MAHPWAWGWDAVGAVATAAATMVALGASVYSIFAPARERWLDRKDATREVVRATNEALAVLGHLDAVLNEKSWDSSKLAALRVRSDHIYRTLDRLLNRTSLTDDAIALGAGAMSIAKTIAEIPSARELREHRPPPVDKMDRILARYISEKPHAEEARAACVVVADEVRKRAVQVEIRFDRM